VLGLDPVAGEDLADRPAVDAELVAQLVDGAPCPVGGDEFLGLLGVELTGVRGGRRLGRLGSGEPGFGSFSSSASSVLTWAFVL
jgi:hypothetical protein